MTVFVDDMRAKFGPCLMCHMIADTDAELHAMAFRSAWRGHQKPPKASSSHYDGHGHRGSQPPHTRTRDNCSR